MTGSAFDRIVAALEAHGHRVRHVGPGRVRTTCTHEGADNPEGLSVWDTGSRVNLFCHTRGCSSDDILSGIGLSWRDRYPEGEYAATYRYDDGRTVHRKRNAPKTFTQSGTKATPSLYRLAKVRDAVASGVRVWLVEGEEDVAALEAVGQAATTAPMGAGNFAKVDCTPLTGADVWAVVDRDPAGDRWAESVRDKLAGVATVTFVQAAAGKDASDHITAGLKSGDFVPYSAPVSKLDTSSPEPEGDAKRSAAALLVELALARYRFGCTPEGEPFGVPVAGGHVVRLLRGSRTSLRAELATLYRKQTGRIAAQQALADALLVLEGEAQDAEPEPVHLRVAEQHGVLWVDLGDAAERAVRVTGGRWEVVEHGVPVLFRRTALTGAMPTPVAGGDLGELWDLLNVAAEDRALVMGWLTAALGAPDVSHPILALFGEQGTGKSTACRLLVDLVDPSPVPLRKPPRDMDSWVTAAAGSWVVGLDNLSAVPDWLSDTLCRAATGDGDVRRQLYTDSGLAVFAFRRVLLLNGIDLGGLRGDLTERLLAIRLDPIPDARRRTEKGLAEAWAAARPRLLGALFGEVARMASQLPYVRLGTSPRMADFAAVLAALDDGGLERYSESARAMSADSLSADPFIAALLTLAAPFEGKAAELLALVTPAEERPPRGWPTNPRHVTTALRRNAPALRHQGWTVDDLGAANKENATWWRVAPPEIARNPASPSSPNSPEPTSGEEASQARQEYRTSQDDTTDAGLLPLDPDPALPTRTPHTCPRCGGPNHPDRDAAGLDCLDCYARKEH